MRPPYLNSHKFITFEDQVLRLEERGLSIGTKENRYILLSILKNINFYRLKGYCLKYYEKTQENLTRFKEGTSFQRIHMDYNADRRIRLETFNVLQDIEISLRSQIAHTLGSKYGAFPYKAEYFHAIEDA